MKASCPSFLRSFVVLVSMSAPFFSAARQTSRDPQEVIEHSNGSGAVANETGKEAIATEEVETALPEETEAGVGEAGEGSEGTEGPGATAPQILEERVQPPDAERDPMLEAKALELAGFRGLATLLLTSDPSGSDVSIGKDKTCITPCRMSLPPGRYKVTFQHSTRETISVETEVTSLEQIQVHAMLGQGTPWKLILPAYFVGGIFTAGGISSLIVHSDTDPQPVGDSEDQLSADERRFHRNLGIASLAVGIPILGLATYLLLTGRPGEVQTSVAPGGLTVGLAPIADMDEDAIGMSISGSF